MDDLTTLNGIGKASAKALVEAGIDSFAALAALDPENPPDVPGLRGPEWAAWINEARAREGETGSVEASKELQPDPASARPAAATQAERRIATVASRIDHDGETYHVDDLMLLSEDQFTPLAKAGALHETAWDDCARDDTVSPG